MRHEGADRSTRIEATQRGCIGSAKGTTREDSGNDND